MSPSALKKVVTVRDSTESFRNSVSAYEELLEKRANIPPRPVQDHVWETLASLDHDQAARLTEQIDSYTALLADAAANGISLVDDKRLTWFAMKKLRLIPPNDLLEIIEQNDYVEVYNAAGIQIFRSLAFYQTVTYSIAEITLYPWDQLYRRDPRITQQIVEQGFIKGFSGIKSPFKLEIENHDVTEAMSAFPRTVHLSFGWLVPLTDQSRAVVAVLATSKMNKIEPK